MDFLFKWIVCTILTLIITSIVGTFFIVLGSVFISVMENISCVDILYKFQWFKLFMLSFVGSIIFGVFKAIEESQY